MPSVEQLETIEQVVDRYNNEDVIVVPILSV